MRDREGGHYDEAGVLQGPEIAPDRPGSRLRLKGKAEGVDPRPWNILAFCAGGGGLELGIRLVLPAARTIVVVEREAFALAVLAEAAEDGRLAPFACWSDARTFDGRPWRGVVDCFAAGIPCQPHSCAGRRLGAADERNLWPDAQRVIDGCRPGWVFLENVGGAVAFFGEHVIGGLEGMGYRVEAGLFTAAEVGAPHRRERLFVLGYLADAARHHGRCGIGGEEEGVGADGIGRGRSAGEREGLADARRQHEYPEQRADGAELERGELPLFPPGPVDLDSWREVLEADPSVEPAICGMADGLASRVDRLRMLGNGVVPLVAGYAFATLLARHWHRAKETAR